MMCLGLCWPTRCYYPGLFYTEWGLVHSFWNKWESGFSVSPPVIPQAREG